MMDQNQKTTGEIEDEITAIKQQAKTHDLFNRTVTLLKFLENREIIKADRFVYHYEFNDKYSRFNILIRHEEIPGQLHIPLEIIYCNKVVLEFKAPPDSDPYEGLVCYKPDNEWEELLDINKLVACVKEKQLYAEKREKLRKEHATQETENQRRAQPPSRKLIEKAKNFGIEIHNWDPAG